MQRGSCLCGAIRFTVEGELRAPDACHCTKCRKHSGHYFVSTDVPRSAVTIEGGDKVSWFQSSEKARRGFCSVCGSSLFWDPLQRDWIGIAMGAFDTPTQTRVALHIYLANKGDYYDLEEGTPRFDTIPPKPHPG
ncbi:GFA family protein [Myxococcus fulvus]|uniref:GFA family protein n=1 Tax=Myxococcus fulvus TaxID=33 RepID=UPI003B9BF4BC